MHPHIMHAYHSCMWQMISSTAFASLHVHPCGCTSLHRITSLPLSIHGLSMDVREYIEFSDSTALPIYVHPWTVHGGTRVH